MMKVPVHQVIDVVSVRHRFMPAIRAVHMILGMSVSPARATVRMSGVHGDHMFIDVVLMRMVQVPVMQVIDVSGMLDCGVSATRSVLMLMSLVFDAASVCSVLHGPIYIAGELPQATFSS
jgi:hypothetical protein